MYYKSLSWKLNFHFVFSILKDYNNPYLIMIFNKQEIICNKIISYPIVSNSKIANTHQAHAVLGTAHFFNFSTW